MRTNGWRRFAADRCPVYPSDGIDYLIAGGTESPVANDANKGYCFTFSRLGNSHCGVGFEEE